MITAEQKLARRKFIGSSDIAAIMGLDPWKSAGDVYLEKIGALTEWAGNEATNKGNRFEEVILDWAEEFIRRPFQRNIMESVEYLAANFDGIRVNYDDNPFVVEAKYTESPDDWGDAGTDEIPERVLIQTHHQMYVAGPQYKIAYVPVLLAGHFGTDFRMYIVNRNDDVAEMVAKAGREFMEKFVIPRIRPDDYKPSLEVLRRVKRYAGDPIAIDGGLIDAMEAAKEIRLQHEKEDEAREDAAKAALWSALDTAECGRDQLGRMAIISTVNRRGYTVEPSSYKQLKIRVPKLSNAMKELT